MGASLIQVALYNLNLNIGVSGFGLSITGGDIGVVAVRADAGRGQRLAVLGRR